MSVPSDIIREQELMEQMKQENLAERQRVIDSMQPKSIEIQQYVEKTNNPNPVLIVGIALVIIAVLWLLNILFVKKSMSGMWLYDKTEFLIDHDKFSNNIKISIPKMPNFKIQSYKVNNGSFLLTMEGEPDMFFIYNSELDCFYVLKYFKDGSVTNEEDKKESTASRIILNVKAGTVGTAGNAGTVGNVAVNNTSQLAGPLPNIINIKSETPELLGALVKPVNNVQYRKKKLNGLWKQDGNSSDVLLMKYDEPSETIEIYDKSGKTRSALATLIGNSFTFRVNKAMEIKYTFNDDFNIMTSIIMPGGMVGATYTAE
jgi:hypothetical protein